MLVCAQELNGRKTKCHPPSNFQEDWYIDPTESKCEISITKPWTLNGMQYILILLFPMQLSL